MCLRGVLREDTSKRPQGPLGRRGKPLSYPGIPRKQAQHIHKSTFPRHLYASPSAQGKGGRATGKEQMDASSSPKPVPFRPTPPRPRSHPHGVMPRCPKTRERGVILPKSERGIPSSPNEDEVTASRRFGPLGLELAALPAAAMSSKPGSGRLWRSFWLSQVAVLGGLLHLASWLRIPRPARTLMSHPRQLRSQAEDLRWRGEWHTAAWFLDTKGVVHGVLIFICLDHLDRLA
jgi:hypothetical protein